MERAGAHERAHDALTWRSFWQGEYPAGRAFSGFCLLTFVLLLPRVLYDQKRETTVLPGVRGSTRSREPQPLPPPPPLHVPSCELSGAVVPRGAAGGGPGRRFQHPARRGERRCGRTRLEPRGRHVRRGALLALLLEPALGLGLGLGLGVRVRVRG